MTGQRIATTEKLVQPPRPVVPTDEFKKVEPLQAKLPSDLTEEEQALLCSLEEGGFTRCLADSLRLELDDVGKLDAIKIHSGEELRQLLASRSVRDQREGTP